MIEVEKGHLTGALLISLSLGLAPFVPEPHIWGKLRWIAGGARGMTPMDWFDTALHGTPWLALITLGALFLFQNRPRGVRQ